MAGLSLRYVNLYDNWPGEANPNLGIPGSGFDSTNGGSGNCVTEPAYPIGTKIMSYNESTLHPGWYTAMYLQFCEGSDTAFDIGDPSTGYNMCGRYCTTQHNPDGGKYYYRVTSDVTNSDMTKGTPVAFAFADLSGADTTTTGSEFGWFWVGGVCPCCTNPLEYTRMGGEIKTDGDVLTGEEIVVTDDGTNAGAFDVMCLTVITELTNSGDYTKWQSPIGRALATDA